MTTMTSPSDLEARVRELEAVHAQLRDAWDSADAGRKAAEQQLADANALVASIRAECEAVNGTYKHPDQLEQAVCKAFDNIRAHLAAQPAAPSDCLVNECLVHPKTAEVKGVGTVRLDGPKWPCGCPVVGRAGGSHSCPKPSRTEAEQAAWRNTDEPSLRVWAAGIQPLAASALAELARRGLK